MKQARILVVWLSLAACEAEVEREPCAELSQQECWERRPGCAWASQSATPGNRCARLCESVEDCDADEDCVLSNIDIPPIQEKGNPFPQQLCLGD
jgi:hypothetical protein